MGVEKKTTPMEVMAWPLLLFTGSVLFTSLRLPPRTFSLSLSVFFFSLLSFSCPFPLIPFFLSFLAIFLPIPQHYSLSLSLTLTLFFTSLHFSLFAVPLAQHDLLRTHHGGCGIHHGTAGVCTYLSVCVCVCVCVCGEREREKKKARKREQKELGGRGGSRSKEKQATLSLFKSIFFPFSFTFLSPLFLPLISLSFVTSLPSFTLLCSLSVTLPSSSLYALPFHLLSSVAGTSARGAHWPHANHVAQLQVRVGALHRGRDGPPGGVPHRSWYIYIYMCVCVCAR